MPKAAMRPQFILIPACLICAVSAEAGEMPKRKPGLWEIKVVMGGRAIPMRNVQHCTSAETDVLMATNLTGMIGNTCGEPAISANEGTITIDVTCKVGGKRTATRAIVTGDFDSAYTVAVTSTEDGAPPQTGTDEPHLTMQAKWIGPCKEGQRPGDVILPGGIRLNVRSLGIETGVARPVARPD